MNDYLLSFLLGIVEGLTEFIPVSSTAHLRIAEALLGVDLTSGYWKVYTIVIQLGAILSLPVYFGHRIRKFLATFPQGEGGDRNWLTHPLGLTMAAFFVSVLPVFLMNKFIGKQLESLYVMGSALVVGGIVMWLVDARHAAAEKAGPEATPTLIRTWQMEKMTLGQAIWVGLCQILSAVFPGTSRSMATIAGGQLGGMSRAAALEFSFFLSMPTMVAASSFELLKTFVGKNKIIVDVGQIDKNGWVLIAIGFVVSFIVGYGSVAWFMGWVRKHGFVPFAIYRIVIGALVLAWAARLF